MEKLIRFEGQHIDHVRNQDSVQLLEIVRSISEWWENLSLPGQSESKRNRRTQKDEER